MPENQRERFKRLLEELPWDTAERKAMENGLKNISEEDAKKGADKLEHFFKVGLPEMRAAWIEIVRGDLKRLLDKSSASEEEKEGIKKFLDTLSHDEVEQVSGMSKESVGNPEKLLRVCRLLKRI